MVEIAPRVVEQPRPFEVARPAASLRPEPTPAREQQKRAAELWQALVNKRDEEEQAPAAPRPRAR